MEKRYLPDPVRVELMNTDELRESFLIEDLFKPGELMLVATDADRAIVGSAVPTDSPLTLTGGSEIAADNFCDRREVGIINIGGDGTITIDGVEYAMTRLDALYIGCGVKDVTFASADNASPAKYYLVSYPSHAAHPTTHAPRAQAQPVTLGSTEESNRRTIFKYIHPAGVKSSQLVMGCTLLEKGSVWNTMAAHTHDRRSEVYLYFDVADNAAVFHFMGDPKETRHLVVRDGQAVVSPSWSIHAGCGTQNYAFVWGMGGENQDFGDMDGVEVGGMR